jgi:hypothetical protein
MAKVGATDEGGEGAKEKKVIKVIQDVAVRLHPRLPPQLRLSIGAEEQ